MIVLATVHSLKKVLFNKIYNVWFIQIYYIAFQVRATLKFLFLFLPYSERIYLILLSKHFLKAFLRIDFFDNFRSEFEEKKVWWIRWCLLSFDSPFKRAFQIINSLYFFDMNICLSHILIVWTLKLNLNIKRYVISYDGTI